MPKLTAKYQAALAAAKEEGLSAMPNQEALYQEIGKRGYFWTPTEGRWIIAPVEDAEPASTALKIRVWCDMEIVEDIAGDIVRELTERLALKLVEQSPVYPCRPPKQLDGRVYLTFSFPELKHHATL